MANVSEIMLWRCEGDVGLLSEKSYKLVLTTTLFSTRRQSLNNLPQVGFQNGYLLHFDSKPTVSSLVVYVVAFI